MITVSVKSGQLPAAREFFELFKTPWSLASERPESPAVLVSADAPMPVTSKQCRLLIVASSTATAWDTANDSIPVGRSKGDRLQQPESGLQLPVYTDVANFTLAGDHVPLFSSAAGLTGFARHTGSQWQVRLGYDLFAEAEYLLGYPGQPRENSGEPTLETHIEILRRLMLAAGLVVTEIANHPYNSPYIACLTHDIDFWGIRRHLFDRTAAGFFFRALVQGPGRALSRRQSWRTTAKNLKAAAAYPFVQLGALPDFWRPLESYQQVERELRSTFFVIPRKGHAGRSPIGSKQRRRATPYEAGEVSNELRQIRQQGWETELHGLDAWSSTDSGFHEKRLLEEAINTHCRGVRMHWLYFNSDSWKILDKVGFDYDSTIGYNSAIGFRAGTGQPYRPLGVNRLLELPMAVQDTALFYPGRMNLHEDEAWSRCDRLILRTSETGGSLVVNWHGRSLAPERQWGGFYSRLLDRFRADGAWIATAAQTVDWFGTRRCVRFSEVGRHKVSISPETANGRPLQVTRRTCIKPPEHLLVPESQVLATPLEPGQMRLN